jgi:hypothetical protein
MSIDPTRPPGVKHNPEIESFDDLVQDEIDDPRSLQEHPEGSAPPLDRLIVDRKTKRGA